MKSQLCVVAWLGSILMKELCSETQKLVNGSLSGSPPLAAEISSLEDSTVKVGKLSVEQRKEKIQRYMKKRNERNFSKKIKVISELPPLYPSFFVILLLYADVLSTMKSTVCAVCLPEDFS